MLPRGLVSKTQTPPFDSMTWRPSEMLMPACGDHLGQIQPPGFGGEEGEMASVDTCLSSFLLGSGDERRLR